MESTSEIAKTGTKLYSCCKILATTDSLASTLGKLNPFRYRGYVYDDETGLYYLRSRYYNPEWGRFVNADALLGQTGRILSHNLFAYCVNSPVNKTDPSGQAAITIGFIGVNLFLKIVAAACVTGVAVVGTGSLVSSIRKLTETQRYRAREKELTETRVKRKDMKSGEYYFATVWAGDVVPFGSPMDLMAATAYVSMEIALATQSWLFTRNFGIYTRNWDDAAVLAASTGMEHCTEADSEYHGSNKYLHFHDLAHSMHLWYGEPIQ